MTEQTLTRDGSGLIRFIAENLYELLHSFNILCVYIINSISFYMPIYHKAQEFSLILVVKTRIHKQSTYKDFVLCHPVAFLHNMVFIKIIMS